MHRISRALDPEQAKVTWLFVVRQPEADFGEHVRVRRLNSTRKAMMS
jgi:hypothetical protein